VVLPDGTDAVLRDVGWRSESFESPPYYVVRGTYWLPRSPSWGIGVDFTHAKAILEREVVEVSGRVAGEPFTGLRPTTDFLRRLEMAHGLNTLTANLLVRRPSIPAEAFGTSRLGFYAGLGAGIAIPRVEAHRPEAVTRRYQLTGPALQGVLGTDIPIDEVFSIVVEYKVSWIDLDMDLVGGGRLATRPWIHQLAFGLGISQ
jgi:lipid A oxidase